MQAHQTGRVASSSPCEGYRSVRCIRHSRLPTVKPFQAAQPRSVARRHLAPITAVSTTKDSQTAKQQVADVHDVPGLSKTVWGQHELKAKYPSLLGNLKVDVCVVGAGIAGLSIAYDLVKKGKNVVVIEKDVIGRGQTGKTTAHLMIWNDDYYYVLQQQFGMEKARLVAEAHGEAIRHVADNVKEEGIECDFKWVDSYLVPHSDERSNIESLEKEFAAAQQCGLDVDWSYLQDEKNGHFGKSILFKGGADFQPLDYIHGLAEAITKRGGRIYEGTMMSEYSDCRQGEGKHKIVKTRGGHIIEADNVVLATNSPINHNLTVHSRQNASRSYVLGIKAPKGSIAKAQWWDTNSPYTYTRIQEMDDYDVLVIGGQDHETGMKPHEIDGGVQWKYLENYARMHWPILQEVVYNWSGQVYKPIDLLHLYGNEPGVLGVNKQDDVYVATGDSGQGMTGGTIAGMVISDLICGRANKWADLFSPSRAPPPSFQSLQGLAEYGQGTIESFRDLLLPGAQQKGKSSVEDLGNGEGAVIQSGIKKVAAYRDTEGKVWQKSAVCTHLDCLVQWNPNDETFDCPCHGSQFDPYGRLIQGPAKSDLGELDDFPIPPLEEGR